MKIKPRSAISSTVIVVVIVVVILIAAAGVYVGVSMKPASTVTVTSGTTATITSGTTATITSGTTATVTTTSSSSATLSTLSPPVSITFSATTNNINYLDEYAAANGGFCSQLGLDVTWTPSPNPVALGEGLSSGQIQMADLSLTSAASLVNTSVPITGVAVGFGGGAQGPMFSLAIANNSKITSVAQLKGTGFIVASSVGAQDLTLRLIAQQYGLTVGASGSGADIIDLDLASASADNAALLAGTEPGATNAWAGFLPYVVAGDMKILANYTIPQDLILATNSLIAHSPNVVRTFLQCYFDATAYLLKNETFAIQMAQQMLPGVFTTQEIQDFYRTTFTNANSSLPRNGVFTPLVLQQYASFYATDLGTLNGATLPPISQMYTTQFVPVTVFSQSPSG